jgi:hypothetical protein
VTGRRIVIVGSFSTGKTTLSEAAALELDLPILRDVAREISGLGFKLDMDATVETETLIFLRQYVNELSHAEFIGDYSIIHVLAYAGWVLEHQQRRKEFALFDACLDIARHHSSNYSHIFYLPIEFGIVPDGLRPDDEGFQKEIDRRIVGVLDHYRMPYETLTGTVEERLAKLVKTVGHPA